MPNHHGETTEMPHLTTLFPLFVHVQEGTAHTTDLLALNFLTDVQKNTHRVSQSPYLQMNKGHTHTRRYCGFVGRQMSLLCAVRQVQST